MLWLVSTKALRRSSAGPVSLLMVAGLVLTSCGSVAVDEQVAPTSAASSDEQVAPTSVASSDARSIDPTPSGSPRDSSGEPSESTQTTKSSGDPDAGDGSSASASSDTSPTGDKTDGKSSKGGEAGRESSGTCEAKETQTGTVRVQWSQGIKVSRVTRQPPSERLLENVSLDEIAGVKFVEDKNAPRGQEVTYTLWWDDEAQASCGIVLSGSDDSEPPIDPRKDSALLADRLGPVIRPPDMAVLMDGAAHGFVGDLDLLISPKSYEVDPAVARLAIDVFSRPDGATWYVLPKGSVDARRPSDELLSAMGQNNKYLVVVPGDLPALPGG